MTVKQITERTVIPISLVIVLVGAVLWAAKLEGRVSACEKEIDGCSPALQSIDRRLSRIEGKLGVDPK